MKQQTALEPKSEVAELLTRIGQEYEMAAYFKNGYSHVGGHAFITTRLENMVSIQKTLTQLVGDQAAALIADYLDTI